MGSPSSFSSNQEKGAEGRSHQEEETDEG